MSKGISIKKEEDFSKWYTELIEKAELADVRYGIKGFVVYREWAQITIEKMFREYQDTLELKQHMPLCFPSLIPEKNFLLESDHVEGFTPDVFWLEKEGEEKFALRPTSETAFYQMYSLWIRSHRDLPYKRYQRGSVFRAEKTKTTRPFFRGREFHWIETHNVFATKEDALAQVKEDMQTTKEVLFEEFGIPHMFFERPQWDKFPGGEKTFAADALMGSGKVLQLPSTHYLGVNFSKPFNVKYQSSEGKEEYGHITCYGPAISRIYGAMIALHSDNKGLRVPFKLSPLQIAIVPVRFEDNKEVLSKCEEIKSKLSNYTVKIDDRDEYTPGFKFNEYELKGVPIRIEIGPRDVKENKVVLVRRDTGEKLSVDESKLKEKIKEISLKYDDNLISSAGDSFEDSIVNAKTLEEVKKGLDNNKIVRCNLYSIDLDSEEYAKKLEEQGGEVRGCRIDKDEKPFGPCIVSGKKASKVVYVAKSY
ncbi:MAG: proline--tRNA ligase [Candidatus Woesearchaeota archaeon]